MRAAWYERTGAARDVLVVGEMPDVEPGPGTRLTLPLRGGSYDVSLGSQFAAALSAIKPLRLRVEAKGVTSMFPQLRR
jgi:hypothetical protein